MPILFGCPICAIGIYTLVPEFRNIFITNSIMLMWFTNGALCVCSLHYSNRITTNAACIMRVCCEWSTSTSVRGRWWWCAQGKCDERADSINSGKHLFAEDSPISRSMCRQCNGFSSKSHSKCFARVRFWVRTMLEVNSKNTRLSLAKDLLNLMSWTPTMQNAKND